MFPRTPLQVCVGMENERTNWEVSSSLEGPALLGYNLCPWQRLG